MFIKATELVTVYTQPDCLPCKRVIAKFQEAGIEVEVVDITKDLFARDYVERCLHAKSTPVVEAAGFDVIVGYQPDKVKQLIDELTLFYKDIHDYVYEGE